MKLLIVLVAFLALASARLHKSYTEELRLNEEHAGDEFFWYTQKLDHFNPQNNATWMQRYYDIDQYWDSQSGPLFLYICGEGTCRQPADNSFVVNLAKEFKGRVLALEHRFYGMSQPTSDWSTENLRYLTPDLGLADLAQFATEKSEEFSAKHGIPHRRWITVGGSYPGALSAWFRYKYPHVAFASLASSGVVDAIANYHQYDEQVYNSTAKSGIECPERFAKATQYVEGMINDGHREEIFKLFDYDGDMVDGEFYYFWGDLIAGPVQYGARTTFCEGLLSQPDDIDQQLQWLKEFSIQQGMVLADYKAEFLQNTTIEFNNNGRQWTYQTCANLGYFQTPAEVGTPMRGKNVGIDFWEEFCGRVYGIEIFPDTHHWNTRYGAKQPRATKIIFTNGSEDPWKHASITESDDPNIIPLEIVCDDCAHCVDLHGDSPDDPEALTAARKQIKEQMREWINAEQAHEKVYPSKEKASLRELLQ